MRDAGCSAIKRIAVLATGDGIVVGRRAADNEAGLEAGAVKLWKDDRLEEREAESIGCTENVHWLRYEAQDLGEFDWLDGAHGRSTKWFGLGQAA
jgi:hypothetical protein